MWILRKLLRIPWTDHVTNAEILHRANPSTVAGCSQITAYLGYILHGPRYNLLKVLTGKIEGKRGPGRKQHWFHQQHQELLQHQ